MQFSVGRYKFRPKGGAFALTLAVCALTISLGNWQTRRAEEKRVLAERFEEAGRAPATPVPAVPTPAGTLAFKHLVAQGQFLPQFTVLLDNKVYRGRTGYFVVTPLRVGQGPEHVLVNRGWIAAGARREDLPTISTPAGNVSVEGYGLEHAPRVLVAGNAPPEGKVWQHLEFEEFTRWSGLALQPVFLEQRSDAADGLVRDWPKPDFGIERHVSYAIQWYLIAALAAGIFISLSIVRDQSPAR